MAASTDGNGGPRARERECGGSGGAAGAKYQDAAGGEIKFFLEGAQHADVVGVGSIERTVTANRDGVYGANIRGQWIAALQKLQDGLFVRKGDAETANTKCGNGFQEILELANHKRQIDGVDVVRGEGAVVEQGRK